MGHLTLLNRNFEPVNVVMIALFEASVT